MFNVIYLEDELAAHPKALKILNRFPDVPVVKIKRYGEIFNRNRQNFRRQKTSPTLILANKHGNKIHPIPKNYGIGKTYNFYFSHILNCPFDCGYCFLQGMYRSSAYVLFVNYPDFQQEMGLLAKKHQGDITFFSGYDGDSMALESLTSFFQDFYPFFQANPQADFEIRTKSANVQPLLSRDPLPNCIIAYSLNPEIITKTIEKKTPSLRVRIKSLAKIQKHGWPIGLRLDPIILHTSFDKEYDRFLEELFKNVCPEKVHSLSLGSFRLPKEIYRQMLKNNPGDKLLATLDLQGNMFSYPQEIEQELIKKAFSKITEYISKEKIFLCND